MKPLLRWAQAGSDSAVGNGQKKIKVENQNIFVILQLLY